VGDINNEPVTVPDGYISVSFSVVQISSPGYGTAFFYCL